MPGLGDEMHRMSLTTDQSIMYLARKWDDVMAEIQKLRTELTDGHQEIMDHLERRVGPVEQQQQRSKASVTWVAGAVLILLIGGVITYGFGQL